MKFILTLVIFTLSACSQFSGERAVSSKDIVTLGFFTPNNDTAKVLEQVKDQDKLEDFLKKQVGELMSWVKESYNYEIKYSQVTKLPGNALAQIIPEIKNDKLTIHLKLTDEGIKNPFVVLEQVIHLYQITNAPLKWGKFKDGFNSYVHAYHWAEVVWNASSGSKVAEAQLARNQLEAAMANEDAFKVFNGIFKDENRSLSDDYFKRRLSEAEENLNDKIKQARVFLRDAKKKYEARKVIFDKLEKQDEKFNDLVAKNDRKGVRKLLETYLPWEFMEPSEKTAWNNWLEAMEKPNLKNQSLVFRGMYDDIVHRNAKKEVYLFSTIINKNQGNYNRRLRSLTTMRERPFSIHHLRLKNNEIPYETNGLYSSSVAAMMFNHSVEAKGSPFLSTASIDVAMKFGPRQIGVFLIDERRLMPNPLPLSIYTYQHERFVPLVIFPDEVVHFHDYADDPQGISKVKPLLRKAHFIEEVEKKIGRKVTKLEETGFSSDKDFLDYGVKRLQELFSLNPAIKPNLSDIKTDRCMDLVKNFF